MKRGLNIQINFTNRFLYTFVALIFILIIGIGVFALTPGVAPNPGHLFDEFAPPVGCGTNQVLQWDGINWACADGSSLWTSSGSNVYYNLGSVGIGTDTPDEKLDVAGNIKASGTVCDGNGCIGSGSGGANMAAFTQPGGTFTVPAGVNSVVIEIWGGGGGGDKLNRGGGGAYAHGDVSVTPGEIISVVVGAGGAGRVIESNADAGGTSSFKSIVAGGGGGAGIRDGGAKKGLPGVATGGDININGGGTASEPGNPGMHGDIQSSGNPGLVIVTW